jgi:transcriptional regulator with XRE-family HTH domain
MPAHSRSRRARLAALRGDLRARGWTWTAIAARVQHEEAVTALVAFRLAHGLTQRQVAEAWNRLFQAADGTGAISDKHVSGWESWPQSGHEPSLRTLKRLARLYACDIADLVEDGRFSHLDDHAPPATARPDTGMGQGAAPAAAAGPGPARHGRDRDQTRQGRQRDDVPRRGLLLAGGVAATGALLTQPARVVGALYTATHYHPDGPARTDQPTKYARTLLILALAHAGLDRIDEAAAAGRHALQAAPLVWPTRVLAGRLDHVLTARAATTAAAADYHARYVEAARPRPRPTAHPDLHREKP